MTINKKDYSHYDVTHGEQLHYVFITLKELIIIQWEHIREHRLWTLFNTPVEKID